MFVSSLEEMQMLNFKQNNRIARLSVNVVAKAIAAFPDILAECEPEHAATVVADLIKAHLVAKPEETEDSTEGLARVFREIDKEHQERLAKQTAEGADPYAA